eukprot:991216_1
MGCSPSKKEKQVSNAGVTPVTADQHGDKNVESNYDRMSVFKSAESYRGPPLCSTSVKPAPSDDSTTHGPKNRRKSSTENIAGMKHRPKLRLSVSNKKKDDPPLLRKHTDIDAIQRNLQSMEELGDAGALHHRTSVEQSENSMSLFSGIARGKGYITCELLEDMVNSTGLSRSDPRLEKFFQRLDSIPSDKLKQGEFNYVISSNEMLIRRALTQSFIVPDWSEFCQDIKMIHDTVADKTTGNVASYIPELAKVNPEYFAVSVCTIDGQSYSLG